MVDLFHNITIAAVQRTYGRRAKLGDTRDVQLVTEGEGQEEGHRVASDV